MEEQNKSFDKKDIPKAMQRSYIIRAEGMEIKINTMRLLYEQLELLIEKSQKSNGDELLRILEIVARLGQAILPD